MEIKTPKVTLLDSTSLPMETVYSVWEASKGTGPLITPAEVNKRASADPEFAAEVRKLFRAVIAQRIPIGEHVDFVFMLENISISWREQAVRHRIGTIASPERIGADIVMMDALPDLAQSSWWSQSMRIQDMGKFALNGEYRVPQTILDHPNSENLLAMYRDTMGAIEDSYNALVDADIPMEDARELMPLGAQHRMSWKLNIGSLQHIVGKRGCWILQLGIWGPVIMGMIEELSTKIDPIFGELVTPPCLKGDDFNGCIYHEENRRRYTGDDAHAPCPLHFRHHHIPEQVGDSVDIASAHTPETQEKFKLPMAESMRARAEDYQAFWGRNPYTGKRLNVIE
jgi:hypothetical protein